MRDFEGHLTVLGLAVIYRPRDEHRELISS